MYKFTIRTSTIVFLFQILPLLAFGQLMTKKNEYTKYDTLLGTLSSYRNYNVLHYNLAVEVHLDKKTISGSNEMDFETKGSMDTLQLDLFANYSIPEIKINGIVCSYYRDKNHIFIITKEIIKEQNKYKLTIKYEGTPIQAKKAPWDGGFVWQKDSFGDHWVGVACEGLGASSWWPCKDHWSDEPEKGIDISITVPQGYKAVSNGKFIIHKENKTKSEWIWFVQNPINLYDVTLNIAKYDKIEDFYNSPTTGKTLKMTYWVLRENLQKALTHFNQVYPMMECYESKLGAYPFYEDGYQLVETPYLGMEHQSCIAYGNKYRPGYLGSLNYTGGHDFDYIIIHETGHEWFGNNITAADNADMWIHEGLTTYAESIYVDCLYGSEASLRYINKMKTRVANREPIQGEYGVAKEGAGDMYPKGALFFHTLRYQINNDGLWYDILRDMNTYFGKRTTSYNEFVSYFNQKTNRNFESLFSAYLQYPEIPKLSIQTNETKKRKKEKSEKTIVLKLEHPKNLTMNFFCLVNGVEQIISVSTSQPTKLTYPLDTKFEVVTEKGYFDLK